MTSRYRVEYALKQHRRDEFIEWIKGLLAVPFVLNAGSGNHFLIGDSERSSSESRRKYAEVFADVERLLANQLAMQTQGTPQFGRIKQLVPTVGHFFTALPLERAFYVQDAKRAISRRRMVAPSFNDVRHILNTGQVMALAPGAAQVQLVTFDGDVTLYDDGKSLEPGDAIVARLLDFLRRGVAVGIVTAAGYPDASGAMYYTRLRGLIDAVRDPANGLTPAQRANLLIMGGECNYLFRLAGESGELQFVDREEWALPEILAWKEADVQLLLDRAEQILERQRSHLELTMTRVYRKDRAVGIIPLEGQRIPRDSLEEMVLNCQHSLQATEVAQRVHFTAFNGGADVWVDIGDKRYGVMCLQRFLGGITPARTLHVGDQFASVGANDFKARLAACTVWTAGPAETVDIMDELLLYMSDGFVA